MRKILTIILAITMCMAMALTAYGAEKHPARFVDGADLLTAEEEVALTEKLDEISIRQGVDVAIVTTNSLGGKTATEYADDYFDYKGYGMGDNDDGIIFVISMGEREWAISTHAYGITAFTDAGQAYITDTVVPYMSDGDFNWAFNEFADLCDQFITQAKTGEPYDVGNMPDDVGLFGCILMIFPCFIIALIIAFILKLIKKSSLKTVMMKNDASDYRNDFQLTGETDVFLYRDVVRTKIEDDDDGGSSTHTSSSGRTHGGSSGSF